MRKGVVDPYSDKELVMMVRAGSVQRDKALSHIAKWEDVRISIRKWILSNSGQRSDSEDMYVESLVLLDRKIRHGDFTLSGSLKGYLSKSAKFLWLNRARKQSKVVLIDEFDNHSDEDAYADELYENTERSEKLQQRIKKLGERCQQVLKYWVLNYSMVEIAEEMEMSSEAMARKIKYKCLKKLKELMK